MRGVGREMRGKGREREARGEMGKVKTGKARTGIAVTASEAWGASGSGWMRRVGSIRNRVS